MSYVSGVLVGCKYLALMYDYFNDPKVSVESYYAILYNTPNGDIVSALDRLYQQGRYWRVPIIVMVYEYKNYLKETRSGY